MRKYTRPMLFMEKFIAEQSVASGCTRQSEIITTKDYRPQTVTCIITTSDNIFGSSNCSSSGYDIVDSASLVAYGDEYYYVWSNTNRGSDAPSDEATAQLQVIAGLAGINPDPKTNGGYTVHAGPAKLSESQSISYSFSY